MARQSHKQGGVGGVMARLLSPYGHRQGAPRFGSQWPIGMPAGVMARLLSPYGHHQGAPRFGAQWPRGVLAGVSARLNSPYGHRQRALRVTVADRRARWCDGATTLALWPPPGGRSGHSGLMGKAQC